jgi:tetratricopeptide (TPR) repeat protein
MAVKSLEMARSRWQILSIIPEINEDSSPVKIGRKAKLNETLEPASLRPEQYLYFELSLGSIYESAGKDDIAMSCYMRALNIKLAKNHPDEAFAYCGLGSVLYHIDEPAWALRCYLKAR